MKNITTTLFVILGMTSGFSQQYEDTGFAGENFSLEGALEVFKRSNSLDEFERRINQQDNNVNNLDLNNDGQTDYIVVEDIQDNNTHVIVLSTYLNEYEKQDIATINIQKTGNSEAILEIIGDESLYASNTIIEPYDVADASDNSYYGPSMYEGNTARVTINVWFWPSVRFIYAPRYVVWVSPHRWAYYPRWWRPWTVYHHHVFYTRCAPHRVYYHRAPTHRVAFASKIYEPRRHSSTLVVKNRRTATAIHQNNRGNGKAVRTYTPQSRTETSAVRNNRSQTTSVKNNRANEKTVRTNTSERRNVTPQARNNRATTTTQNNRGNEKAIRTQTSERGPSTSAVKNNRASTATQNNRGNEKVVRTQTSERGSSTSAVKNNRSQTKSAKNNRGSEKANGNGRR